MIVEAQSLSDIVEQISSSTATIESYHNNGTGDIGAGFFISSRVCITCAHVVGLSPQNMTPDLRAIVITTKNKNRYYASIIDYDVNLDAAVLYVNIPQAQKQYYLNLGNSGTIRDGEAVVTIGSPLGYTHSISYGIVANKQMDEQKRFFLLDLRTNPGNSGGMIFSIEKHAIVGMAAAVLNSKDRSSEGISVGIAIDAIKKILIKNKIKFVYKETQQNVQ
jgi:S1-C subfamily serine protease